MIAQTAEFIAYGLAAFSAVGLISLMLMYLARIVRGMF
jgi:hypothetical protein